jgi:hypothetical protein
MPNPFKQQIQQQEMHRVPTGRSKKHKTITKNTTTVHTHRINLSIPAALALGFFVGFLCHTTLTIN